MGDEPSGRVTHAERHELDALRRRAYGPRADILDDVAALARLRELEDRLRSERFGGPGPVPARRTGDSRPDTLPPAREAVLGAVVSRGVPPRASPPRVTFALIAGTAAAAIVLGAVAWSGSRSEPADRAAGDATQATDADADERSKAEYERYLDGLRDELLSLPGSERIAGRMLRDQIRPYGILYGRTVGSGPTVDHEYCMIIADQPTSSITCIPGDDARATPVSVTLPAWYSDSESDLFTGLGDLVSYTLMPGGSIVAAPADSAEAGAPSDQRSAP